jgi:hypothetical protein
MTVLDQALRRCNECINYVGRTGENGGNLGTKCTGITRLLNWRKAILQETVIGAWKDGRRVQMITQHSKCSLHETDLP